MFVKMSLIVAAVTAPLGVLAGEVVYLMNCNIIARGLEDFDSNGRSSSMAYYADQSKSQGSSVMWDSRAHLTSSRDNRFVWWEDPNGQTGVFDDNGRKTTFTVKIRQGVARYQYAGDGQNSWGQKFKCFRDNDSWLWQPQPAHGNFHCKRIYWCQDA